jgi:hypothetical protein
MVMLFALMSANAYTHPRILEKLKIAPLSWIVSSGEIYAERCRVSRKMNMFDAGDKSAAQGYRGLNHG